MTLIKSISGIRGTVGGQQHDNLTPPDVVKFTAAYGTWLIGKSNKEKVTVALGRDARISGDMVNRLVVGTLQGLGIDVIDLGLSTTPTVEVAVEHLQTDGGIILTASHNPKQWNALKLLNNKGEFISGTDGEEVLAIAEKGEFNFADVDDLGDVTEDDNWLDKHIELVLALPLVDVDAIKKANFKVAVDAVNSSGGIFIPALLDALGVEQVEPLFCDPTGYFPHNPEPLPEHIEDISNLVREKECHLGIIVDPDVDRLAFVDEKGDVFGEEYTLVAVADYVLSKANGGNSVSNLSSTRALRDVTNQHGGNYYASAVGEVNVVTQMKDKKAVIGGEGNGGIIYPELHYGRDALVGVALFLTHLANKNVSVSELRASYPNYFISKNKISLTPEIDVDKILAAVAEQYKNEEINTIDGVKIDFAEGWVHLRKSNTEPIIRIYAESSSKEKADNFAKEIIDAVHQLV